MAHRIEKDWITAAGLRAVVLVVMHPADETMMSHRCGYVGISQDNQHYGKDYNDLYDVLCGDDDGVEDCQPHGCLTYGDGASGQEYPVAGTDLHWYGFDAHHLHDAEIEPQPVRLFPPDPSTSVRSQGYMEDECEKLARGLARCEVKA